MTFETFIQSDKKTWHDQKKLTKTKTFWEHLLRAILETCDIWDPDYNSDNWEPEFMTIFVNWQLIVTLDSICNSCDVSHVRLDSTSMFYPLARYNAVSNYIFPMQPRLAQRSPVSTVLQRLVTLAAGFIMAEWGARWVDCSLWHRDIVKSVTLWHWDIVKYFDLVTLIYCE